MSLLNNLMNEDVKLEEIPEVGESPTPRGSASHVEVKKQPIQDDDTPVVEVVNEPEQPVTETVQTARIINPDVVKALGLTSDTVEVVKSISEVEILVRQDGKEYVIGIETLGA